MDRATTDLPELLHRLKCRRHSGILLDYELIHSLGCDAILNVPVVWGGVTLGTCNLMHEEGWYDKGDTEIAITIASIAAPAYLHVSGDSS